MRENEFTMKTFSKWFVLAVAIGLCVGTLLFFLYPGTVKSPSLILDSILVTPIQSSVLLASSSIVEYAEIKSPTATSENGRVKTSATGRALIEGVHTTVIDSNTEMIFSTLKSAQNQTRIQLEAGNVWSRVKKLSDKGEFYEIETQTARASVRGTSFGMKRNGNITELVVVDGVVRFGPVSASTGDYIPNADVLVTAGKKAVMNGSEPPVLSDLTDEDKQDLWFLFNNPTETPSANADNHSDVEGIVVKEAPLNESVSEQIETVSQDQLFVPESILPLREVPPLDVVVQDEVIVDPEPIIEPVVEPIDTTVITEPIVIEPVVTEPVIVLPVVVTPPSILLSSISPSSIQENSQETIILTGSGFVNMNVQSILFNSIQINTFQVVDDTTILLTIPIRKLAVGLYDVTVHGELKNSPILFSGFAIDAIPLQ